MEVMYVSLTQRSNKKCKVRNPGMTPECPRGGCYKFQAGRTVCYVFVGVTRRYPFLVFTL